MAGRRWTKEEENFLRENYKTSTDEYLVKILGRNKQSIQRKAMRLGVDKGIHWTKEEEDYLAEKWDNMKKENIAKKLGRTVSAIETKAKRLKLGSRNQWYSLLEIEKMTGISASYIRKLIVRDNLPCHKGKTNKKTYMFDDKQLKSFLKKYQDVWHYKNLTINIFENQKWYWDKVERDKEVNCKRHKFYTKDDDKILFEMFKVGYSYEDIALTLNRTAKSVRARHVYRYKQMCNR